MTQTLKKQAIRSGSWVILGHVFSQILRFGSNLILTRLLVPEMFGVMAIVTVIMGGLAMFSDVGLMQNIIQSERGEERDFLNTAWTIQALRGALIFIITLIISLIFYQLGCIGYLSPSTAYGNAQLPMILVVMSITALIAGANSIYLSLLNRKLLMGKLITIDLVSQVVGLMFMFIWALYSRDIWALVFGTIISSFMKLLLSHSKLIAEKCHWCWDKSAVHEIFHFGKWIFLSSILGFLLNQGDRILLGGMIDSQLLGVYTVAFFLANALKDVMSNLIGSVFYPVISEIVRSTPDSLENIYYKIRNKIDFVAFFTAGFIFSAGQQIIGLLYDQRYQDAGWMLEVLALSLVSVGNILAGQCFLAHGKAKLISLLVGVQVIFLYCTVPLIYYFYGWELAIWAIALNPIIGLLLSMLLMKKYFFLNIKKEILALPFFGVGLYVGEGFNRLGVGLWG